MGQRKDQRSEVDLRSWAGGRGSRDREPSAVSTGTAEFRRPRKPWEQGLAGDRATREIKAWRPSSMKSW